MNIKNRIKKKWDKSNLRKQFIKVQQWVMKNLHLIQITGIVLSIGLVVLHLSFFVLGVFQTFGKTPHYYCNQNASDNTKSTIVYQQYCNGSSLGNADNKGIAEAAISLATVDTSLGKQKIDWTMNGMVDLEAKRSTHPVDNFITLTPKIIEQANLIKGERKGVATWTLNYYASCDLSVASAVLWSGADDNFPMYLSGNETTTNTTYGQTGYLLNNGHNGKWIQVPRGDKVLPGDIALGNMNGRTVQHVWMYVATWENGQWVNNDLVQARFPGSTSNRYEGSNRDYYSMLSRDGNPWESSEYIFRFVGEINELSSFRRIGGN